MSDEAQGPYRKNDAPKKKYIVTMRCTLKSGKTHSHSIYNIPEQWVDIRIREAHQYFVDNWDRKLSTVFKNPIVAIKFPTADEKKHIVFPASEISEYEVSWVEDKPTERC